MSDIALGYIKFKLTGIGDEIDQLVLQPAIQNKDTFNLLHGQGNKTLQQDHQVSHHVINKS